MTGLDGAIVFFPVGLSALKEEIFRRRRRPYFLVFRGRKEEGRRKEEGKEGRRRRKKKRKREENILLYNYVAILVTYQCKILVLGYIKLKEIVDKACKSSKFSPAALRNKKRKREKSIVKRLAGVKFGGDFARRRRKFFGVFMSAAGEKFGGVFSVFW